MFNPHTALMSAWRASLTFCAAAGCTVAVATDWVEPRTALDRAAVYHAGFDLRVADQQGRPVAATVAVCQTGQRCDNTNGRLAMAMTDERGQVAFRDLSSSRSLQIFVEPPEQLRPRHLQFEDLTNANANLGTLRLKRNRVITGTVRQVTHSGAPPTVTQGGRVLVWGVDDEWPRASDLVRDGRFRLADFDLEPGMEIEFDYLRAPLEIDPESDRYHFDLVADRAAGTDGLLRVVENRDVPPEPAPSAQVGTEEPTHRIDLRLVATDGKPIAGAAVSVVGVPGAESVTDAGGRLSMATVDVPEVLSLRGPWGIVAIGAESPKDRTLLWGRPPDVVADILGQSEVRIPVLRRVGLEVSGIHPRDLSYSWRLGHGNLWPWEPVEWALLERALDDLSSLLRVDAPGRLPRFVRYPPEGPLVLDFTEDSQHALVVFDEDGPIVGAHVDLIETGTAYGKGAAVNDPGADIVAASLSTDATGRLARLGNPRALYVAYVYADGYDPARVVLEAGSETRLKLAKRDVRVDFAGLKAGELLRVKVAGRESLVALQRVTDPPRTVVSLAPGSYDVSVENTDGIVDRGNTIVVDQDTTTVDPTADRRPELVLRLPELPVVPERYRSDEDASTEPPVDRWTVWASRRTPPALVSSDLDRLASRTTGPNALYEVDAPQESGEGMLARTLRFSASGRWLVYAKAERHSLPHLYFVEVVLDAGGRRELALPPLDASLQGSMTYEGDLKFRQHGVAGPRMVLIRAAGADTGWNVADYLPDRRARDGPDRERFVTDSLPAGDYHLFHHLGQHSAWGGSEVSLRSDRTTNLGKLGSEPIGSWTVEVVDSKGRPVRDRMLRVRDRMHEAWEANSELDRWLGYSTTLALAADAFPLPPAARLRGEPVSFDSIRPGWVELVLDDPAGPARHYLRKAEPGTKLTLVVDD